MSALPTPNYRLRIELTAALSDEDRAEVARRQSLVDAWRNMCGDFTANGGTAADATAAFLAAHPEMTQSRLYRWAKRRHSDNPADILDGRKTAMRNTPDEADADTRMSSEAWSLFKRHWLVLNGPKVTVCYQIVKHAATQNGWAWPCEKTVRRRIDRDLPPFKADYYRLGKKEWNRRHGVKLARNYDQYRAGEHWMTDGHPFDVFCRRSDTDPTILRPTLTAFLDIRSRVLTGWDIGEHENTDAVLLALGMGCRNWGIPDAVTMDNGGNFLAGGATGWHERVDKKSGKRQWRSNRRRRFSESDEQRLNGVFGGLEIVLHFANPYSPNSKANIERFFGTVETQFGATFASYCGPHKDERFAAAYKLAQDHPERCPTVAELSDAFSRYVEAYHVTPHSGREMNGLSPAVAFKTFNPIPRKVLPEGAFEILIMRTTKPVKVTCYGVRYMGDDYGAGHPQLQLLQGKEVLLRVHPVDAGSVIVCDLEGKPICEAVNNKRLYTGVTQDDIAAGKRRIKRARQLARDVAEDGFQAMHQTITDAAISARLANGQQQEAALLARTGTDDTEAPRGVRPFRSDMADAARSIRRGSVMSQLAPHRAAIDHSIETAVEEMTADPFAGADQQDAWPDLAELAEDE